MKKSLWIALIGLFAFALVVSGCSKGTGGNESSPSASSAPPSSASPSETPAPSSSASATASASETSEFPPLPEEPVKDISGELIVWSNWELPTLGQFFNNVYPDVKVSNVVMDFEELHNKLKTVLAAGSGGPDVVMIDGSKMGEFNTIEGLEDLLQQPYDAGRYQPYFADNHWQRFLSLDGTKLIGVPWDAAPAVTFYRADIMEENGFPSDPVELGEYIADKDNFVNLAKTLLAQKKYVLEWDTTPLSIQTMGIGYFDRDLNWLRNTDQFAEALDLAKQLKQEKLASNINYWEDEGAQALAAGKTAMVYLGNWGWEDISGKAPDTQGKWKATTLPFGARGAMGGATLAIPSQSKNKLAAWEYIRLNLLTKDNSNKEAIEYGNTPGFLPAYELLAEFEKPNDFMGGQKLGEMFESLVKDIPLQIHTPLDAKADEIWNSMIQEAIDKNIDSRTALQQIQEAVEKAVSNDKAALLEKLNG